MRRYILWVPFSSLGKVGIGRALGYIARPFLGQAGWMASLGSRMASTRVRHLGLLGRQVEEVGHRPGRDLRMASRYSIVRMVHIVRLHIVVVHYMRLVGFGRRMCHIDHIRRAGVVVVDRRKLGVVVVRLGSGVVPRWPRTARPGKA